MQLHLPKLEGRNIDDTPCCIFTRDGALLWRSAYWIRRPGWSAELECRLLGLRYLEFVHADDVVRLLKFFIRSDGGDVICFRIMIARTGRTCRSLYYKIPAGDRWLVLVRLIPLDEDDDFGLPATDMELDTYQ